MGIEITVNGSPRQFPAQPTVLELLHVLGLSGKRLAVEVNRHIVPRSRHAEHRLQPGDEVEIVQAMGGG
jgi:sulfur carrier protein